MRLLKNGFDWGVNCFSTLPPNNSLQPTSAARFSAGGRG